MFKKFIAGLTAVVLSLGMVALTAGPANATKPTVSATVQCTSPTQATITWTVTDTWNRSGVVVSSTNNLVPSGTTIAANSTQTYSQAVTWSGSNADYSLNVVVNYGNYTGSDTGRITIKSSDFTRCQPADDTQTKKVEICHANNGNSGWVSQSVSVASIIQNGGHSTHQNGRDIIPPFTYVQQGLDKSFAGLNWTEYGQAVKGNGCGNSVTPEEPDTRDAVCSATPGVPGTSGQYFIPSSNSGRVQYLVAITGSSSTPSSGAYTLATTTGTWIDVPVGKWVHIKAVEVDGWQLKHGATTTWKYQIGAPSAESCRVDAQPVKPTVSQAVCVADGSATGSYTIPARPDLVFQVWNGSSWVVRGEGTYTVDDGTTVQVRVYAAPGYVLTSTDRNKDYKSYDLTISSYDDRKCQVPTPPKDPQISECTGPGQASPARYWVPTDDGVKYTVYINDVLTTANAGWNDVTGLPKTVRIVASATGNNVIVPGSTVEWTYQLASAGDCLRDVTPATPDFTDSTCNVDTTGSSQGGYFITSKANVVYTVKLNGNTVATVLDQFVPTNPGDVVEITATAANGYRLTGYTEPWSHEFADPGECLDDATPATPTFSDEKCTVDGPGTDSGYYVVNSAANVTYRVQINGGGWTAVDPSTYGDPQYVDTGDVVEIEAIPAAGYQLVGYTEPWSHTFTPSDVSCLDEVAVDAVTAVNQTCVVDPETNRGSYVEGWIVIPSTPNVSYFVDGDPVTAGNKPYPPGTYTISAAAGKGYTLTGVPEPWTVTIGQAEPCGQLVDLPTVEPEVTFTQTTCSVAGSYTLAVVPAEESAGVIWTVSGGLPNTVGKHNVTTVGTVDITATPAAGYGFPEIEGEEVPVVEWSFDFAGLPDDCLPTLALTGGGAVAGAVGLGAVLTLGGVLILLARRREALIAE